MSMNFVHEEETYVQTRAYKSPAAFTFKPLGYRTLAFKSLAVVKATALLQT